MTELTQFRIGSWIARPTVNLLEREGRSVRIEPRAMDVLVLLASNAGRVVSIEELMQSVWKGVVVGEGSVYLAIRQLRQALNDADDGARYIETIPKRGYRLTAPVEPLEAEPVVARDPPPSRRVWWIGGALACAVLIAAVLLSWRHVERRAPANSVAVLPFENLSSDPEQEYFADGITLEVLNALTPCARFAGDGAHVDVPVPESREGCPYGRCRAGCGARPSRQRTQGRRQRADHRAAE